jgi:calcineurin-like phosphoesterase
MAQSMTGVSPRIGIHSSVYTNQHSIQVAGAFQFDIGLTALLTDAIGLKPNLATFTTMDYTGIHPDEDYTYTPADLMIATAVMR